MIDWLNNLHPTVNALIVVLGSTTALLTLAAALRSCWRACRKLFRRRPVDPNKVERNKRILERTKPRFRETVPPKEPKARVFAFEDGPDQRKCWPVAYPALIHSGITDKEIQDAIDAPRKPGEVQQIRMGYIRPMHDSQDIEMRIEGTKAEPRKGGSAPMEERECERKLKQKIQQAMGIPKSILDLPHEKHTATEMERIGIKDPVPFVSHQCSQTKRPHVWNERTRTCLDCGIELRQIKGIRPDPECPHRIHRPTPNSGGLNCIHCGMHVYEILRKNPRWHIKWFDPS